VDPVAGKSRADLRDQFLASIGLIAKPVVDIGFQSVYLSAW